MYIQALNINQIQYTMNDKVQFVLEAIVVIGAFYIIISNMIRAFRNKDKTRIKATIILFVIAVAVTFGIVYINL